jgi:hypothetical protein
LDENAEPAPTTADVLHENLKRQSQQFNSGKVVEPTVSIRTMDSNNFVRDLLKKS